MPTILLDENIDGYSEYLSRFVFSPAWSDISTALGVRIGTFDAVGLAKGAVDAQIWEYCQDQQYYLITDNRNQASSDSLESVIRARTLPTSLPVFTISDLQRFRSEREYVEAVVAKLLEHLLNEENLRGAGRLYLP